MSQPQTIALVGNPNAGKTTLFNALTHSNERVGNYSGVTVDIKSSSMSNLHGKKITVLDLPGCYSLRANSPDEEVARRGILGENPSHPKPDLAICVIDASHLERHLILALQVIELGVPTIIALNMVDVAEKQGIHLNPELLSSKLGGIPVIPIQAKNAKNLTQLKQQLSHIPPISHESWLARHPDPVLARQIFLQEICPQVARRPDSEFSTLDDRIDHFCLHPIWGWCVLALTMFTVFWAIFSLAEIPMGWIESGVGALSNFTTNHMQDGDLRNLLTEGVIAGVGNVIVFLPQILLLFFFIGLLESSGYMARAAFMMDSLMAKVGLTGKSFLPLFSSYACAIPGILATRTIASPKDRIVTIFIAPWMSCSARLPVYFLLVPLMLGNTYPNWLQAAVLFGLYLVGTISAFLLAKILRKQLGAEANAIPFILELPPYRAPQWSYIARNLFSRAGSFLKKAATLIFGLSILLWALSHYPKSNSDDPATQLAHSAFGRIGHVMEPLVKPLGFDGRVGTAILTSFAARETFNATIGVLFHAPETGDEDADRANLRQTIAKATWPDGRPLFTPLSVISLLLFYIYALQCLPTVAVAAREFQSWKWALGQLAFMSITAYTVSLIVFQLGKALGLG